MSLAFRTTVLDEVHSERERQDLLWGTQDHAPAIFLAILTEEVGEVAKEVADSTVRPFNPRAYRLELIQTAAVAVAAVQALDRMESQAALDRESQAALDRVPAPSDGADA